MAQSSLGRRKFLDRHMQGTQPGFCKATCTQHVDRCSSLKLSVGNVRRVKCVSTPQKAPILQTDNQCEPPAGQGVDGDTEGMGNARYLPVMCSSFSSSSAGASKLPQAAGQPEASEWPLHKSTSAFCLLRAVFTSFMMFSK